MKKRSWLTVLFLVILLSIAIVVRVYYVNRLMVEVTISEEIYSAAKKSVAAGGLTSVFADGFRMQSIYICNLYLMFLIFGNFTVSGVYLNILYQVLTVLLVYFVVKNLTNRYIGFAGSLVLAILPIYMNTLSEVTVQNMKILIAALSGAIIILIARWIYRKFALKKNASHEVIVNQTNPKEKTDNTVNVLLDRSMREIQYDDLEENNVQYIENPLPTPKRKEHKEMDYAFEPTDNNNNNDYDMKDLTGKDYYDIE